MTEETTKVEFTITFRTEIEIPCHYVVEKEYEDGEIVKHGYPEYDTDIAKEYAREQFNRNKLPEWELEDIEL